jgi:UDP-N-acetylmuramyl-tripeptide synthetase
VVAVTGTNGKTSTTWWLAQALSNQEHSALGPCALVGTLGVGLAGRLESTGMTTPDPVLLQRSFRKFADAGARSCAIEASSIGLAEHRLVGTRIPVAVFTNFTQDHLDYHASMEAYWQAKAALFDWPGLRAAAINIDDPQGAALHAALQGRGIDLWSLSQHTAARLSATEVTLGEGGLRFCVREGERSLMLQTQVIGSYNVSNLLGVIAAQRALGVPLEQAVRACEQLQPVPGRMERIVQPGQPLVAVDYAHTPDALQQALQALRPLAQERGGQLWCVFGCGGDRDAGKRPLMGGIAQRHADWVVVTSDNPRSERPADILHQILLGTIAGEPCAPNRTALPPSDWPCKRPMRAMWCSSQARATRTTRKRRACDSRSPTWHKPSQHSSAEEPPHDGHDLAAGFRLDPVTRAARTPGGRWRHAPGARAHRHAHPAAGRSVRGPAR